MSSRVTALMAAAAISLTAAAPALGALSVQQAGKAASAYGQGARRQLRASSVKVWACRHVSGGRVACRAEARFTRGARRCTFEVLVAPSANGQPPVASPAKFVCY